MPSNFPSVTEILKSTQSGELKAVDLVQQCLDRIGAIDKELNSVLVTLDSSLERAEQLDAQKEKNGELHGIPFLVKDNFCVKGTKTTAASKILENFVSPYTAFCIERLEAQGAIVVGKTNMDEFAMGSSNENSAFGLCKNPWNPEYVPGGSSGGSAAAVAAGLAPVSIGSDTGGSIRQPASFCGVVGIKPTYGRISRYGMIAFASSLDQAGPIAQSVSDAARFLKVMVGKDVRDSTNVEQEIQWDIKLPEKIKVGIPKEYFEADLDETLRKSIDEFVLQIKKRGCEIIEISLPHTDFAIPVYYLVAASEASSNLSRYDGVRYGLRDLTIEDGKTIKSLDEFYKSTRSRGFGDEVKRRILLGTFSLSAGYSDSFYKKACQVRRLISDDFSSAFEKCDFIVGPVSTDAAFKIGEKTSDPVSMYYNDILTTPANLAGLPAMSLPIGVGSDNRPLGLQIIAPAFADAEMIKFAELLESWAQFEGKPHVQ